MERVSNTMASLLNESFTGPALHPGLFWFCEPTRWTLASDAPGLFLHPDPETDFWQRTHYGFQADNGHALLARVEGDFRVETRVRFHGLHQYDQAGLLLRFSPDCWLKTSVEFEPGAPNRLGAVVTRHGYSDWSTQDIAPEHMDFAFRLTRTGADFLVEASVAGASFSQIRLAHLEAASATGGGSFPPVSVGLYACSPKAAGFEAHFAYLKIDALSDGAKLLPPAK
jgi:regulation of enolase protein 1 (concanavalin A-like superfamily)